MLNATCGWMDTPSVHGTCPPIHSKSTSYVLFDFCLSDKKIHVIFVFYFSYCLSFLFFFLPYSRITRGFFSFCEISHNIKKVHIWLYLSVYLIPVLFGPTPPVHLSPYKWILVHETGDRIHLWPLPFMECAHPSMTLCNTRASVSYPGSNGVPMPTLSALAVLRFSLIGFVPQPYIPPTFYRLHSYP